MTDEQREYQRKYRKEHPEQTRKYARDYYKRNRERLLAASKQYQERIPKEKKAAYRKEYYEKHKSDPEYMADRRANHALWVRANRDKLYAYHRERRKKLKEKKDGEQK